MSELFEQLVAVTGLGPLDLQRIIRTAPRRYKRFTIPKRNGGVRWIAQPARELKLIQRALVSILLENLPVHPAATAYRTGLSIRDNAAPHAGNGPILKLDLKDFFPSLRAMDWAIYCHRTGCLERPEDIALTSQILFFHDRNHHGLRLAIGAPSSPILSNILMFEFDRLITEAVAEQYTSYTRYADDMTFSASRTGFLTHIHGIVQKTIRGLSTPHLQLNETKTTTVTKRYHRTVTGLTLTNDCKITIGKQKKRLVRAMVHRFAKGELDQGQTRVLSGVLAYVNAVEPEFLSTLRRKYGLALIVEIQKAVVKGNQLQKHDPPLALRAELIIGQKMV